MFEYLISFLPYEYTDSDGNRLLIEEADDGVTVTNSTLSDSIAVFVPRDEITRAAVERLD